MKEQIINTTMQSPKKLSAFLENLKTCSSFQVDELGGGGVRIQSRVSAKGSHVIMENSGL